MTEVHGSLLWPKVECPLNEIHPSKSKAIEQDGQSINYAQFCGAVGKLAEKIEGLKLHPSRPVAILMERGFGLYTSQFAVLASGGFFLPIDPANPDERIRFLLSDSQSQCILTDSQSAGKIDNWQLNVPVIQFDQDSIFASAAEENAAPITFPHKADAPAYMIYTSGSTGKPKGVCIHWEAICSHNRWFIDEYKIGPNDRCLQIASIGFDISIEEIFTTIRSGGCLVPINKQALDSPAGFFAWVAQQKLTVLNMPTALWHNVIPALEATSLPDHVRLVIIGGEQVNPDMVEAWFKFVPAQRVRLVNGYGPTETTITATVCDLNPNKRQAIGQAVKNLQCHILGPNGQLIKAHDTPGELYISGINVAKGYWNRPEQTAKAFMHCDALNGKWCYRTGDKVQRDIDGDLHFLGRVDNQVKLRGYRIELDEIENAISLHPKITSAIVRKTDSGRERLVCFAVPESPDLVADGSGLQQQLVGFLKQSLPQYMVPAQFQFLKEFPLTVGGKVDAKKLLLGVTDVAPSSECAMHDLDQSQTRIVEVWQSVLGSPPDSVETTFEQCGGDSLAAMALALGLEKAFPGKTFGVATLLTYPTVSQLAEYVKQSHSDIQTGSDSELMPIINKLGQPLAIQTPCLIFLHPGGGSGYLYNQLLSERIKQTHSILILDSPWLTGELPNDDHCETTLSIAKRYADVLAALLDSDTRITTSGYSFGGILAFETARFLKQFGFEVERTINIDQPVPQAVQIGSLPNRLLNWVHRLKAPRLTWYELNYSKEKEALQAGEKTSFSNPREMLRSFDLEDVHAAIEDAYLPEHCDVDMHLIRGDIIESKYHVANDYGWQKYSKHLTTHRVTGTHFTLFLGRNLTKLSRTFQSLLDFESA